MQTVNPYKKQNKNEIKLISPCVSHLPDFVLEDCVNKRLPHHRPFEGVILFSDVSGFTHLCQVYASSDTHTASDLVDEFNKYLNPVAECVLASEGDIYKFAGDAILAHWPLTRQNTKEKLIQRVIDCSLELKKRFCGYETKVGTTLHIKSAISYGDYDLFLTSGDANRIQMEQTSQARIDNYPMYTNYYVCCGPAIRRVSACEHLCGPEDIVVDGNVWDICRNKSRYKCSAFNDSNGTVYYRITDYQDEIDQLNEQFKAISIHKRKQVRIQIYSLLFTKKEIYEHYSFLISPVRKKIANREPIEYLSELRTVSVLFARLEVNENDPATIILDKLQRIVIIVHKEVKQMHGIVTKLLMFDKGLSFLCVFGLSGYKYANDSERALKAALIILHTLNESPNIKSCSVGVCTGIVFCGVVGHPSRCEYTVIGRKVNMAARLMVAYPNVVSCDKDTFLKSGLSSSSFLELESKDLKGLYNAGTIRAFEGEPQIWAGELVDIIHSPFPILGRLKETELFISIINTNIRDPGSEIDCIAIAGERGCGRTRLLKHFAEILTSSEYYRNLTKISFVSIGSDRQYTKFWTLQQLIFRLLDLKDHRSSRILSILPRQRSYPQLLNHLFGTDFPRHVPPPRSMDVVDEVISMTTDLVSSPYKSLKKFGRQITVLFIDNIDYIDNASAYFLLHIAMSKYCVIVYTMNDPLDLNDVAKRQMTALFEVDRTKLISLHAVPERYHATVACQMMQAGRISSRITDILRKRGSGLPGRIANILNELELNSFILVDDSSQQQYLISSGIVDSTEQFEYPVAEYMVMREHDKHGTIRPVERQLHLSKTVYTIAEKGQALNEAHIHAADPGIHVLFDRLPDACQIILKICSMIGLQFDSGCIQSVLQFNPQDMYSKAITNLFAMKFIMCSHNRRSDIWWKRKVVKNLINSCECPLNRNKNCCFCLQMKFVTLSDMETANSYIVNEFKADFLPKLINYYENKSYRCRQACEIGDRKSNPPTSDFTRFKATDLVNVIHDNRFQLWIDKMKKIVNTCNLSRNYHLLPELKHFLSAQAFRHNDYQNKVNDKYLALREIDRLDRTLCKIPMELDKCCKPPNIVGHQIPKVKVFLTAGIPLMVHRFSFVPYRESEIVDVINTFTRLTMTSATATTSNISASPKNTKPSPSTNSTKIQNRAFDWSSCRCNMEISRGYRILTQLCQQHDRYQNHYMYYALKSVHTDIVLNEAFDARQTLEEVFNSLPNQSNIDDTLQALLEYFNSVIAFRTKNVKKSVESCERALKLLKVNYRTLLEIYKDKINGFQNRSSSEISLVSLLLLHSCKCYLKLNEYKGAYDAALTTIQILPNDSFIKLEALGICAICCYNLNQPESIDFYHCNSKALMDQLAQSPGYEPLVIRHGWIFMISFFVLARMTDAIRIGMNLLKIVQRINAGEEAVTSICVCLCIAAILKHDRQMYKDMMLVVENLDNKLWYCVLSLDGCMTKSLLDSDDMFELKSTEAVIRSQVYIMFQCAAGRETKLMAKLGCVYAESVLMELNQRCDNISGAIEYFKSGVIELLRVEEWSFIHIYCFTKFALFQYANNINCTNLIPRLIHAYKDICKRTPLFYSIFCTCLAYQSHHEGKEDHVNVLIKYAEVAADFAESPHQLDICQKAKRNIDSDNLKKRL
ncbi:hypothetical protein GJ496_000889 [Pomphorhynchus laevis]|nr:hypothetical protein GJ496_000889 [Pomphorhynchus laevis]